MFEFIIPSSISLKAKDFKIPKGNLLHPKGEWRCSNGTKPGKYIKCITLLSNTKYISTPRYITSSENTIYFLRIINKTVKNLYKKIPKN